MREYNKEMGGVKCVRLVNIGLRWLLSESVYNLGKIGSKLNQVVTFVHRDEGGDVRMAMKELVLNLVHDLSLVLPWVSLSI